MIEKIDETFYEVTGKRLNNVSQLHQFPVLRDFGTNEKFLNISRAYGINDDIKSYLLYDMYDIENDDWWDTISYKYYDTPFLWWIIALMNDVVNPFEYLEAGNSIYVLKQEYLYQLMKDIKNIGI